MYPRKGPEGRRRPLDAAGLLKDVNIMQYVSTHRSWFQQGIFRQSRESITCEVIHTGGDGAAEARRARRRGAYLIQAC